MKIKEVPKGITSRLNIPATVSDSVLPFFKANADSLTEWLDTLPKLNPAGTCRKILPAMETMNLTTLPGRVRYELAECIRPTLFDLIQSSEPQFLDASFPMSDKVAEMTNFSIHFQEALADAYKSVIVSPDFVDEKTQTKPGEDSAKPFFSESIQCTTIHRAMQSIGMVLLRSAQCYRPEPDHVWDQVNALYLLAEQHGLHQIPVLDEQFERHPESTIEELFKKLHFFNLAVPNRFRQRDIQSISHILEESVAKIEISETQGNGEQQANFFVVLNAEYPALHISKQVTHDASLRYFHTRAFVEHLMSDAVLAKGKNELLRLADKSTQLPERTIRKLLQCWHQIASRQFSRQDDTRPVTIYPGLQNIIKKFLYVPSAEKAEARMGRDALTDRFSIAHLELVPTDRDRDVSFDAHSMRSERSVESMLKASKSNTSASDIWKKAAARQAQGEAVKVAGEIDDTSAKGYHLKLNPDRQPLVKVGDLIGISEGKGKMEIAVIRHLHSQDEGGLSMGVELIAPNAQVARIVNQDDNIRSRSVLMLPGVEAIKQPPSVLTVSRLELPSNRLELTINKSPSQYQLLKLIESNPAFSHYTLQKLDE